VRASPHATERLALVACRKPCDTWSLRRIQPFGQRCQHHGDLLGGGFQTREGSVAPGSERDTAGRTPKRLDALGTPMLAISDEGVDLSHRGSRRRGTAGWDRQSPLYSRAWGLPGGFSSHAMGAQAQTLTPHPTRGWR
jgi:hypothetical protein